MSDRTSRAVEKLREWETQFNSIKLRQQVPQVIALMEAVDECIEKIDDNDRQSQTEINTADSLELHLDALVNAILGDEGEDA